MTTLFNVLNADRWRAAGHEPCVVLGHSVGEVAAAYVAGLLCVGEALFKRERALDALDALELQAMNAEGQ